MTFHLRRVNGFGKNHKRALVHERVLFYLRFGVVVVVVDDRDVTKSSTVVCYRFYSSSAKQNYAPWIQRCLQD